MYRYFMKFTNMFQKDNDDVIQDWLPCFDVTEFTLKKNILKEMYL